MADTTQIVTLINQLAALGIEFIPVAVLLAKTWSQSSGQTIAQLADSSDAQIDEAVGKAITDEIEMGFDAPTGELK